jgi:hypothetical protein
LNLILESAFLTAAHQQPTTVFLQLSPPKSVQHVAVAYFSKGENQMNQSKVIFSVLSLSVLIFTLSLTSFAQTSPAPQFQPSYDVVLHVLVGSNEATPGAALPQNLSAISKQLRGEFSFSNYSLANTYLGRVSNSGALNYRSVSNILRPAAENEPPSFIEWNFGNLKTMPGDKGRMMLEAQQLRFGAKIPLRIGSTRADETGKSSPNIVYESIGLDLNRITLPESVPTLVGTLTLPNTSGTLFLVMTAKPVEY